LRQIQPEEWVTDSFGLPTIQDILKELEAPGRDPRHDFTPFEFAQGVEKIGDLSENMVLPGVVTNVTRFGAFVDIGVHQDGLVHVSELSHKFIRDPEQEIHVGDQVKVKVLKVDAELKRIQLSIKALLEPPPPPVRPRPEKRPAPAPQRMRSAPPRPPRPAPAAPRDPLEELRKKWGAK
ncbi:MAG TPA: S1 RNA-binding domain-containing protein, partial [Candidatus Aminicenantes bacterium]|nr:S1 RNA-binding domain-containing protein [Candidatus Aminicenantes bacterium]